MSELRNVFQSQDELGEGPLWDVQEQALYWVDILAGRYHTLRPDSGEHRAVEVGEVLGVLALRRAGGLVLATRRGFAFWYPAARALTPIADPETDRPDSRFNDGSVDRAGRFWAGTMGGPSNNLYRLDPGGAVQRMDTGIQISNGIGWSPDNRVMYYTDSLLRVIYAYDFDLDSGSIANRRVFIDSRAESGTPDGLTVDSQGFIWSARWDGWRVERYDPQGRLERAIPIPVQRPTSVMFGGPGLETLYITSARTEIPAADLAAQPQAGDLFCLEPGIRGLPETRFAG